MMLGVLWFGFWGLGLWGVAGVEVGDRGVIDGSLQVMLWTAVLMFAGDEVDGCAWGG